MSGESEEWQGSRSQKFQGSRKILRESYRQEFNISGLRSSEFITGLEQVKSKRHFATKQSTILPEWKPCLRVFKSASQSIKPMKITEVPCTTQMKPLRHVEKFSRSIKDPAAKMRTLWNQTLKGFKFQEEQAHVKELENWEINVLNKKPVVNTLGYRFYQSRLA